MVRKLAQWLGFGLMLAMTMSGCYQPGPGAKPWLAHTPASTLLAPSQPVTATPWLPPDYCSDVPAITPTPNPPIIVPTVRSEAVTYTVQKGESLANIARRFLVTVDSLVRENSIADPDLIEVGQSLLIPPPVFIATAPRFKIIPDSELVYSPSNEGFDVEAFIIGKGGYLAYYNEEVDEITLSGAEIVSQIAVSYSINPRLLLTVLEYQSGWVTRRNPDTETLQFPLRIYDPWREGLFHQLAFAANQLNEGYYLWQLSAIGAWSLQDNAVVAVEPSINAGSAGVLNLMRYLTDYQGWVTAVSENGIAALYEQFFGYPFACAFEPLVPDNLEQPLLQLPFQPGEVWSFTGGPHGGWDTGSAWAALDFAPPGEALGCFPSESWVVAAATGEIVYADHGAVIQDLDGDGKWQTGWSLLYMHIDPAERVTAGTMLEAGEVIGHPSCEGGFSTGTHVHLARRYNGEWIAADGGLPFVLDGWQSSGYGVAYDGYLMKGDVVVEAWNGRTELNAIQR